MFREIPILLQVKFSLLRSLEFRMLEEFSQNHTNNGHVATCGSVVFNLAISGKPKTSVAFGLYDFDQNWMIQNFLTNIRVLQTTFSILPRNGIVYRLVLSKFFPTWMSYWIRKLGLNDLIDHLLPQSKISWELLKSMAWLVIETQWFEVYFQKWNT